MTGPGTPRAGLPAVLSLPMTATPRHSERAPPASPAAEPAGEPRGPRRQRAGADILAGAAAAARRGRAVQDGGGGREGERCGGHLR